MFSAFFCVCENDKFNAVNKKKWNSYDLCMRKVWRALLEHSNRLWSEKLKLEKIAILKLSRSLSYYILKWIYFQVGNPVKVLVDGVYIVAILFSSLIYLVHNNSFVNFHDCNCMTKRIGLEMLLVMCDTTDEGHVKKIEFQLLFAR